MKINCNMSAAGLLKDCGLNEEAMELMAMAGNQDQALLLYKKLDVEIQNSPKMLCILGKIYRDPEYFKKALEKTNNRYLKALDSLGMYYYSKK